MKARPYAPGKSEIARQILAYLLKHPEAGDTLGAITRWWLLEQRIHYQTAVVTEALEELIDKGFVLWKTIGHENYYQINQRMRDEGRSFIDSADEGSVGQAELRANRRSGER